MLRLRAHTVEELEELPDLPRADTPWMTMATPQAPHASDTLEYRKPGAPGDIVRIGPTVTQVAGFGPHREVVEWLAEAMVVPPVVIGAEAFDDLHGPQHHIDHLEPEERQTLVDRVLELAERAREIEDTLAHIDGVQDHEAAEERASAALALAVEWDAFSTSARRGGTEAASREIDLRARTAELLGRLAGPEPMVELRDYAQEIIRRQPNPQAAVALRSELDRIEAEGRDLVARIDAADGIALPAVRIHELFGDEDIPVIVDGDLLYAVAPDIYDLLLDKLRAEADRRRVVIVLDDTLLDAWLATVHGASVWTTGHLHLVPDRASDLEEAARAERRARAGLKRGGQLSKVVGACEKHQSQLTRLSCSACRRPFCSACLVRVNTKDALLCIDCALERGTGVKRPRR